MSKLRLCVSYDDGYMLVIFQVKDENGKVLVTRTYDLTDLPEDNRAHSDAYGVNKVLTDRTSGEKDKLKKIELMDKVWSLLCSGEWAKERVVGAPVVSPAVEALGLLAEPTMSIAETQEALSQYKPEVRKALLARDDVVAKAKEVSEARKERKARNFDDMVPAS